MSTQTKPPHHHSGDPVLEPREQRRTRHPHEHELLARLAQDLREELPQHSEPSPAEPAPDEPWIEQGERAPGLSPHELDRLEREITVEQRRARRPLDPDFLPPPPPRLRAQKAASGSFTGLVLRLVAVAVVAAVLALIFVGRLSLPARWKESATEPLKRVVALVIGTSQPSAGINGVPASETPKLVVEGADAGPHDEIGLGVKLKGTAEGALVFVSGLAAGTTLSTGHAWGETGWIIQAADLDKTVLRPPHGFVGMMQYTLTLRLADGRSADRQMLRLQWAAQARRRTVQDRRSRRRPPSPPARGGSARPGGNACARHDLRSQRARGAGGARGRGRHGDGTRLVREGKRIRFPGSAKAA